MSVAAASLLSSNDLDCNNDRMNPLSVFRPPTSAEEDETEDSDEEYAILVGEAYCRVVLFIIAGMCKVVLPSFMVSERIRLGLRTSISSFPGLEPAAIMILLSMLSS